MLESLNGITLYGFRCNHKDKDTDLSQHYLCPKQCSILFIFITLSVYSIYHLVNKLKETDIKKVDYKIAMLYLFIAIIGVVTLGYMGLKSYWYMMYIHACSETLKLASSAGFPFMSKEQAHSLYNISKFFNYICIAYGMSMGFAFIIEKIFQPSSDHVCRMLLAGGMYLVLHAGFQLLTQVISFKRASRNIHEKILEALKECVDEDEECTIFKYYTYSGDENLISKLKMANKLQTCLFLNMATFLKHLKMIIPLGILLFVMLLIDFCNIFVDMFYFDIDSSYDSKRDFVILIICGGVVITGIFFGLYFVTDMDSCVSIDFNC